MDIVQLLHSFRDKKIQGARVEPDGSILIQFCNQVVLEFKIANGKIDVTIKE